jgi:hypothetical protein
VDKKQESRLKAHLFENEKQKVLVFTEEKKEQRSQRTIPES